MLTFEEFNKHIQAIKAHEDFQDSLHKLTSSFNRKDESQVEILFPTLAVNVAELLEKELGDTNEWVSYWIWELDFGKQYEPGCVTDENGDEIKLETVKDLYRFLVKERAKANDEKDGGGK